MKKTIILLILLLCIGGCLVVENNESGITPDNPESKKESVVSKTTELILDEKDLTQLGMKANFDNKDLNSLGIIFNETSCNTEEYQTNEHSSLAEYSLCSYTINRDDTEVIIQLNKFSNRADLNGSYQYESLHLRGFQGLISENDYGDQSRFYSNNESSIYYYHLWICKDEYLIHVTSKGTKEAGEEIEKIGKQILSKFEK